MANFRGDREAFGKPGAEPHWTRGDKQGVGTAYSPASYVWFTVWSGILTEIYCPTIDRAQTQYVQYLISDGKTFFQEEQTDLLSETELLGRCALGYRISNYDPEQRYVIIKEIITAPDLPCILQHTTLKGSARFLKELHLYASVAPHLERGGWDNNAYVVEVAGRKLLVAEKQGAWLAAGATVPFCKLSCGYAGASDGKADLKDNFRMDWEFDKALAGNVVLTGELDLSGKRDFVLGIAMGNSLHAAVTTLFQSLATPFPAAEKEYIGMWERHCRAAMPLETASGDKGNLYHSSYSLILGHEDKTYPGAIIASLSIPWGEASGDDDPGGYHLVWTRDMVQAATGLLAAGNVDVPARALIYLAASQQPDGGFPQNFWLDGTPYWQRVQLDQVSFPIILAWRLKDEMKARSFDIYPLVKRAAGYLITHGPATEQERWEEAGGYSPSTLAVNIAALVCAADLLRQEHDEATARYLEEYADFLECHVEAWTVTGRGSLVKGIPRHYIRLHPIDIHDVSPDEDPDHGEIYLLNHPPDVSNRFIARNIVDGGFLELVRYGVRAPGDSLIEDSLRVVDSVLKVDTPLGPCWRRYNHDGYGQREDGGPFRDWGKGRAWPLLVGERAHYEFAAGRKVDSLIKSFEYFASRTGLLPEQVWDSKDIPGAHLYLGKPTSGAMPLVWAHAEYIKLLRSVYDGKVFDLIPPVADRYLRNREHKLREIWKFNRQPTAVRAGYPLRIQAAGHFRLRWTLDEWRTVNDDGSTPTSLGIDFVDVPIPPGQTAPVQFTFFWTEESRWEGRNYRLDVIR